MEEECSLVVNAGLIKVETVIDLAAAAAAVRCDSDSSSDKGDSVRSGDSRNKSCSRKSRFDGTVYVFCFYFASTVLFLFNCFATLFLSKAF